MNHPEHKGFVDTLFGEVVNYDVTQTEEAWQCSLEIRSSNTPLLETEITEDNALKFVFANQLEEIIASAYMKKNQDEFDTFVQEMSIISAEANNKLINDK